MQHEAKARHLEIQATMARLPIHRRSNFLTQVNVLVNDASSEERAASRQYIPTCLLQELGIHALFCGIGKHFRSTSCVYTPIGDTHDLHFSDASSHARQYRRKSAFRN